MSLDFRIASRTRRTMRLAVLAGVSGLGMAGVAQQLPAPKVEVFGGYSAYFPNTTASGLLPQGLTPISSCLCWNPRGAGASVTYDFNRWLGLTADMSGHWGNGAKTTAGRLGEFSAYNVSGGPKFTLRRGGFAPFAEVLFGVDRLTPELFTRDDRFGLLAGGGIDFRVGRHFAIRPIQADFVYSNHQFGPSPLVPATDVRGVRLQAGVVFLFGGHALAMSAPAPAPVAAPLPVPVAPAPVDQVTLALTATPTSLNAGDSSTIDAAGTSSLNRPLTYSFSASAGSITGTGHTAVLTTAGLAAGVVVVTGNAVDDMGQSATQTTTVNVMATVVPAVMTRSLGDIRFDRDALRPARVDNEAKAVLDDITLTLQRDTDARLAVIGTAGSQEAHGQELAAQRAVNTKDYLVTEKGVDASRISVYTGTDDAKTARFVLIPAGATLDTTGLTVVDEQAVKAHPRNAPRRHHK
jgi:outer membrane protein OmpA-like peptidoglycan-associated protein